MTRLRSHNSCSIIDRTSCSDRIRSCRQSFALGLRICRPIFSDSSPILCPNESRLLMVARAVSWLLGDKSNSVSCQPWRSARVTKCSGLLTNSRNRRDVRRYRSIVCGDKPCSHISINRPCVSLGFTSCVTLPLVSIFAMPSLSGNWVQHSFVTATGSNRI